MSRAHCRETIISRTGATRAGVEVLVCEPGTETPIDQVMWDDISDGNAQANPLVSNPNGEISFFLDEEQYVSFVVSTPDVNVEATYVGVLAPGVAPSPTPFGADAFFSYTGAPIETHVDTPTPIPNLSMMIAPNATYMFQLTIMGAATNDQNNATTFGFDPNDTLNIYIRNEASSALQSNPPDATEEFSGDTIRTFVGRIINLTGGALPLAVTYRLPTGGNGTSRVFTAFMRLARLTEA